MKRRLVNKCLVVSIALFSFLALQCFGSSAAHAQQELLVSAAASLTNAFEELGKQFEAANPGVKVIFNFAASGALMQQIDKGAPVDVFASADQKTMDQAEEKNLLLAETRKDFVSNGLVLIVPKDSKLAIKGVKDLSESKIARIAMGNPETVPVGRYAQEVLSKAGLWEGLKPKLIYAENVRQALDYVSRGEVDAGFVFATDAAVAKNKVQVAAVAEGHQPIRYPVAVIAGTKKKDLSQRFMDFLLGSQGQSILARYGFGKP
ncbi:MAG: molybdate ABC transporter substrate-binding protein [Deltaproteobacteria bacterium]|nr:molybdate ABC transporter substrate-binding protein [Deltaproteobacteria bacterium]